MKDVSAAIYNKPSGIFEEGTSTNLCLEAKLYLISHRLRLK